MINGCKLIKLPLFEDYRGSLIAIEGSKTIPFEIKRVFYMINNGDFTRRGQHAHKTCEQVIIPIQGDFTVRIDSGQEEVEFYLDRSDEGLYIDKKNWINIDMDTGDICLVLASEHYSEEEYIKNYKEFLNIAKER
jgi:hypothetical protein